MSYFVFLYVSCSGSITLVGEERANLSAINLILVIMWFLFEEVSSFSGCLEWAALFYCVTSWAFCIIIELHE